MDQVKKNIFTDKLSLIFIIKFFKSTNNLYFVKDNFLSKLLNLISIKKIKKLNWSLIEENDERGKNIYTKIYEEKLVDKFVLEYFRKETKINSFFQKLKDVDKRYFKEFLLITLTTNKNIINSFSLFHFLIFLNVVNKKFKNEKIIYLDSSILNDFLINQYSCKKFEFQFKKKIIGYQFYLLIRHFFSRFKYLFKFNNNIYVKQEICVMDSYQINKPNLFFSDKELNSKIAFIALRDNIHNAFNLFRSVNFIILYKFIKILIEYFKLSYSSPSLYYLFNIYHLDKIIFKNFFEKKKTKIYLTSFGSQNFSSSAVAAISELKGKSIGFSMSLSYTYKLDLGINIFDYYLNFSNIEKININEKNTTILDFGYLGDYKFKSIRYDALKIRKTLHQHGVKFIIGFFDQGSVIDDQFNFGHKVFRDGYSFLINKIINDQKFALIIKPKKPKLLKEKLGPVYNLLQKLISTKRCIVFDDYDPNHVKNFIDIPAKIGIASDLTIHDHMVAGTAAFESALVGTKSVMFDYFKLDKNNIYNGDKNLVFTDWKILWDRIYSEIGDKNQNKFGNWEQIIDNFDQFRDGKTNIRVMNFLKKLLEENINS